MGPPCSPDVSAGRPWRLVTLNTWKGDGPYALRLQAMVHQLRALQADVVALQEVFHAPQVGVHTGRTLAQALGMHLVFAPARRKRRWMSGQWVDSESGLAVLSRWPVAQQRLWPLPSIGADGERLALCCDLNVHGQPLRLVNTHLTHLGPCERGPALRQLQWQTLLTHAVDGWPAHAPLLVCGDLNVPLEDPSLRGPMGVEGWRDVAASVGLHPKSTCPASGAASQDLDHVVDRPCPALTWRAARVVLDGIDARVGVMPSDHAGVLVEGVLDGCHKSFSQASNACHTGL
jgi:endonuclease/exonuclease/phosphatase family metal-dependent hydrolase